MIIPNPVIEIMQEGIRNNWCMEPGCTTCGCRRYVDALKGLSGIAGGPLVDSMSNIDFDDLKAIHGWRDALLIAAMVTPNLEPVLRSWLPRAIEDIRIVDGILFEIVRRYYGKSDIREQWESAGTALALETGDFSLTESLILTMRSSAPEELQSLARNHAESSAQMKRVLWNCGL